MPQETFERKAETAVFTPESPAQLGPAPEASPLSWSRVAKASALGAVAFVATISPGGLGETGRADAAVGQWVSEFKDGVASPVVSGQKSSINLINVGDATELRRKVRLTYLDRCIDSETQGQFSDSIVRLQNKSNDNAKYLKIESMMESGLLTVQLKANSLAAKKKNFKLDYDRCTRAPWTPYVPISMPKGDKGQKKLEASIQKAGCGLAPRTWIMDKIWILNPQRQVDNGETVIDLGWFGFDGTLNMPICKRVDRRDFDHTSPWPRWTREATPKPLIFPYRTSELTPVNPS